MHALNLPNLLTASRIVLIPFFVMALEYKRYDYAMALFAAGAVTDLFDGFLARLKDQRTELGSILDPLADKFMLVTSYVFFAHYGWIPVWLTIIVLSRDVIVVTGFVIMTLITHSLQVEPTRAGKLSTAFQFLLIFFVLIERNVGLLPDLKTALIWVTACLTGLSGLHYLYRGMKQGGGA